MLLVWFWRQEGFKEQFVAVYLADVAELGKGCNTFAHDWDLMQAVVDFLDTDRLGRAIAEQGKSNRARQLKIMFCCCYRSAAAAATATPMLPPLLPLLP